MLRITIILMALMALSCSQASSTSNYLDQYDKVEDVGQYRHIEMDILPEKLINITFNGGDNWSNEIDAKQTRGGLQTHLLAQSLVGVMNKSVQNGESKIGAWMAVSSEHEAYSVTRQELSNMAVDVDYMSVDIYDFLANVSVAKDVIKGYVLTDIENNPESATYAAVASHVYDAIIVDRRDKDLFADYKMLCDATQKSTVDSWVEFKDKCNRNGLVIMSVGTAQLREFAITNQLFVVNLNREHRSDRLGQNTKLFEEILAWLEPNSLVYGWESGIGEDKFVGKVSLYGHTMAPSDWIYNLALSSNNYTDRQSSTLVDVLDPTTLDFEQTKDKYVAYYLSDGDNVQWMVNNFESDRYFTNPLSAQSKIGYGVTISNLSMMNPAQFKRLVDLQTPECSIIETFGGGYYYVDTFGQRANRKESIDKMSRCVAANMRQHRVKVLALMAMDVTCEASQEAYGAYIKANDQLEGIIAMQYTPYAGGQGEIMWFENSRGIDIPVVTIKYSLWNFGDKNNQREGSPRYIASRINAEDDTSPFSLVCVHAWSSFADIDNGTLTDQSTATLRSCVGAGAAQLCTNDLDRNQTMVVGVEEMIWRIRMHYRKEQTLELLETMN
ncbi:MAG: hypothetical protein SNG81_09090 [Rikenellaceae bacterium]